MTNSERREYNISRTIDAALDCFREIGIEATTQVVLARKVRLTTKTIQRYFRSKEEIVLLAMKQLNERYYELIRQKLDEGDHPSGSGLNDLLAFFAAHEVFFDPQNRILLLMTEMHLYLLRQNIHESSIVAQVNAVQPEREYIMRSLEKGIADKSIRSDIDPKLTYIFLANSFAGMIQRLMLLPDTYHTGCSGVDKADIIAQYMRIIKADLQPR